jgi:LPS-assembly lipoprotein
MSSPDLTRRGAAGLLALALPLVLGGCLRPMYGPTASGAPLQDVLASIEIEPVITPPLQERVGHYLRSELVFDLDGSGQPRPKRYKLKIAIAESVQSPIVDTVTGRAVSATLSATATYSLATLDGKVVVPPSTAISSASYDRSIQRFATVRAARDADIRVARVLADQIKTQLAAALATAS